MRTSGGLADGLDDEIVPSNAKFCSELSVREELDSVV
jgi:hypothetical protein